MKSWLIRTGALGGVLVGLGVWLASSTSSLAQVEPPLAVLELISSERIVSRGSPVQVDALVVNQSGQTIEVTLGLVTTAQRADVIWWQPVEPAMLAPGDVVHVSGAMTFEETGHYEIGVSGIGEVPLLPTTKPVTVRPQNYSLAMHGTWALAIPVLGMIGLSSQRLPPPGVRALASSGLLLALWSGVVITGATLDGSRAEALALILLGAVSFILVAWAANGRFHPLVLGTLAAGTFGLAAATASGSGSAAILMALLFLSMGVAAIVLARRSRIRFSEGLCVAGAALWTLGVASACSSQLETIWYPSL